MRLLPRAAPGIALVIALGLAMVPGGWPLFRDGVPATHDGHLHLQRAAALARLIDDGVLFSRWLPDFAYGYGSPLFNYYAPLAYAPLVGFHSIGASLVDSYKLTAALALVGSALAMFLLARSVVGTWGALAAALVYAYAPYQMVNLFVRGALAESLAFVWAPLACWALMRLRGHIHAGLVVALGTFLGALVLTHNITALLMAPCLVALALSLGVSSPRGHRFLAAAGLGLALGLALAAWFWVPALLERDLVQIGALIEPGLFASFLLAEWPPLQTGLAYDYRAPTSDALDAPIYWPRVGLVQAVVTLFAALVVLASRGGSRRFVIWAAGVTTAGFALQFRPAMALYDLVPLAGFVQFPWRLLLLVGLGSALLVGCAVERLGDARWSRPAASFAIVALTAWSSIARLSPVYEFPEDRFLTAEGQTRLELGDFGLGSTHGGEYLPVESGQRNSTRLWKELGAADGSERARAAPAAPAAFEIRSLEGGPLAYTLEVEASGEERLILRQFAFPGWAARIDGRPVEVAPAGTFGLVSVALPPGRHLVEIRFGWTALRLGSVLVSAAALALVAVAAARFLVGRTALRRVGRARLAAAGTAALLGACAAPFGTPSGTTESIRPTPSLVVGESLTLLRANVRDSGIASGRPLIVDSHWLSRSAQSRRVQVVAGVTAADGTRHEATWAYAQLVRSMERGELVRAPIDLRVPAGFPGGEADVTLGVDDGPAGTGPTVSIGTVRVPSRPSRSWKLAAEGTGPPVVDGFRLAAYELLSEGELGPRSARPGEAVDLRLEAEIGRARARDLLGVLELRSGERAARSEPHTLGSWYLPPLAWQAGDRFRQQIRFMIPEDLESGSYGARLLVFEAGGAWSGLAPFSRFAPSVRGAPLGAVDVGVVEVAR